MKLITIFRFFLFVFSIFVCQTKTAASNNSTEIWGDAKWIRSSDNGGSMPRFRKLFEIKKDIKSATVYSTALGVYDIYINGYRVGEKLLDGSIIYDELKPGWTDYRKTVMYQTYDVTSFIKSGKNIIGAYISNGWWHGWMAWGIYGEEPMCFILTLRVEYNNGDVDVITTDVTWKSDIHGALQYGDLWNGENYDARLDDDWLNLNYDDSSWMSSLQYDYYGEMKPQTGGSICELKDKIMVPQKVVIYENVEDNGTKYGVIRPIIVEDVFKETSLSSNQKMILDFGQNMAGIISLQVKGNRGCKVRVRYAEMLNDTGDNERGNDGPGGSIYVANLRTAKAETNYTLAGNIIETYRPISTYFGFRYCEISTDENVIIREVKAHPFSSAIDCRGEIYTSDKDLNKLFSNIQWGQYSNFMSIPTDCPQRDERWGWLGDAQVFCRTAMYNAKTRDFYRKYLADIRDTQREDGAWCDVAPFTHGRTFGNAGWSDAGIIIPWNLYLMYGDKETLKEHYYSMVKYMDYLESQHSDGMAYSGGGVDYGDWLAYDKCDNRYVSVAYYANDARLMMKMSEVLSCTTDDEYAINAKKYHNLFDNVRREFLEKYWNPEPSETSQTTFVLPLAFELLYPHQIERAKELLQQAIGRNSGLLSTGFLGTSVLMQTLSKYNLDDEAYNLILQRRNPSWLYSIDQGATTIWERWDSYTKEKGFAPDGMNSFNHYAYGAVGEWMYRYMLGIDTDENAPGFTHIILRPHPDYRLSIPEGQMRVGKVSGSYDSEFGKICVNYSLDDDLCLEYSCKIPANTISTLYLPRIDEENEVVVNGRSIVDIDGIEYIGNDGLYMMFNLEPGTYSFKEINSTSSSIKDVHVKTNVLNDILYINSPYSVNSVIIYDINGKEVCRNIEEMRKINISSLKPGVYVINVRTTLGSVSHKLIKP